MLNLDAADVIILV